jgi:hypothetical protein
MMYASRRVYQICDCIATSFCTNLLGTDDTVVEIALTISLM